MHNLSPLTDVISVHEYSIINAAISIRPISQYFIHVIHDLRITHHDLWNSTIRFLGKIIHFLLEAKIPGSIILTCLSNRRLMNLVLS